MKTLSVSVTFHNGTSNAGNASNIIKCLKKFALYGLARGLIDRLEIHTKFHRDDGEVRESRLTCFVRQDIDGDLIANA